MNKYNIQKNDLCDIVLKKFNIANKNLEYGFNNELLLKNKALLQCSTSLNIYSDQYSLINVIYKMIEK